MTNHQLGELANSTWLRLSALLANLGNTEDKNESERRAFVDDTRSFFDQRLAIYEQRRNELRQSVEKLIEHVHRLLDQLGLERSATTISHDEKSPMTLAEEQRCLTARIEQLERMILERAKELFRLRDSIDVKVRLIGDEHINIEQVDSTARAHSILSDLRTQLNTLKQDLSSLLVQIRSLDPDCATHHASLVDSFVTLNENNEATWLSAHHPWTGRALHSHLLAEHQLLYDALLAEVIRLRAELGQNEPSPPYDLQKELADLRLRKRYMTLLTNIPHQLTARSSLAEIRQTYDRLTTSMRAQARARLVALWNELDVPIDQRQVAKSADNDDDDYLAITDEIARLEAYVESIRPLLVKIQKREWYKREMIEFEKRAGDPARLRGSSTQLLKEERFRKDLAREFPKLTDDLRRMVTGWEEASGKKLIYGGEPYLETMNKEKLGVDFELLHLRLLTKCHVLVQHAKDDTMSTASSIESPPPTPPPISPGNKTISSRIPTITTSFAHRKTNKPNNG